MSVVLLPSSQYRTLIASLRSVRTVPGSSAGADVHAAIGVVPIAVIAFIALGTLGEIGAQDVRARRHIGWCRLCSPLHRHITLVPGDCGRMLSLHVVTQFVRQASSSLLAIIAGFVTFNRDGPHHAVAAGRLPTIVATRVYVVLAGVVSRCR